MAVRGTQPSKPLSSRSGLLNCIVPEYRGIEAAQWDEHPALGIARKSAHVRSQPAIVGAMLGATCLKKDTTFQVFRDFYAKIGFPLPLQPPPVGLLQEAG